jgi:hypothetical protein
VSSAFQIEIMNGSQEAEEIPKNQNLEMKREEAHF